MIVAGDIGGTKTILALYEFENSVLACKKELQFASAEYRDFLDVIREFIASCDVLEIDALCLGIAGPIINGVCHTTNLPWLIDTKELQKEFHTSNVTLLNDLEATAYGMLYLEDDEFMDINPTAKVVRENRAVIAAGTGLGEATLFYDGVKYHPIGSEGGHCDFAPLNPLQDELLVWMRTRHKDHVSVERLVCGDGISTIYEFLKEKQFAPECERMLTLKSGEDKNALITASALKEGDALSLETLRIFVEIYGAEAGNLALKSLSLGGVYIGGGIAPKILPFLLDGVFLKAFTEKGRFQEMLQNMPIKISLNPKTALLGAAHFGMDRFIQA